MTYRFPELLVYQKISKKMTHPKSERRCFGALLGRVFHVQFTLSKGMLFEPITEGEDSLMLAPGGNREWLIPPGADIGDIGSLE